MEEIEMSGTNEAWNEVGERFASWGRHLAERYKDTSGPVRESAQESQRKLEAAGRDITDALDRAFTALSDTIRDEQAKQDLKEAVRALGDAVSVTVTETTQRIRQSVGSSGSEPHPDGEDEPGPTPSA
jgi:actin-like ATPase involved in cell morphogenesis